MVRHRRHTRAGGGGGSRRPGSRWPRSRPSTAWSARSAGAPGRSGSGRRGGSRRSSPRQVRNRGVGHVAPHRRRQLGHVGQSGRPAGRRPAGGRRWPAEQHVGPVGHDDQGEEGAGLGPLQQVGQGDARLGRPEVPDRRRPVGRHARRAGRRASCGRRRTARACRPTTATWSTSAATTPAVLRASAQACVDQGDVDLLAEPLLPHLGVGLARRPPPVEELGRRAGVGHPLGRDRVVRAAEDEGDGAVTAVALLGPPGQPGPQVGQHGHGPVVAGDGPGRPQGPDRGPHRADHVVGAGPGGQFERAVDGRGVGLVQVGRRRGGEEQVLGRGALESGERPARRLHPHGGGVLVVGGDRPAAPPGRGAEAGADGAALEPPVREVDPPGDDAGRHRPGPRPFGGGSTFSFTAKSILVASGTLH